MSIPVTCPECEARYRVDDEVAGISIKCRECGAKIRVSSAVEERAKPAKSSRRRDDEDDYDDDLPRRKKAKKKAGSNTGLILAIVGGVMALGCLVCGGGTLIMFFMGVGLFNRAIDQIDQ